MARPTGRHLMRDLLLLILGAVLYTIATPPYEWSSAAWLALTPLYLVLQGKTLTMAFVAGFLYGVLFGAGITGWAYASISAYFPLPFPFDFLATVLSFGLSIGIYTGLVASLSCVLMRSERPVLRWSGIPAVWVSGELIRSYVFFGFCWELLGYTQHRHLPLIQIADLTGVYGLSYLLALSSYVAAEFIAAFPLCRPPTPDPRPLSSFPWPALGFLTAGIGLVWCYGTLRLPSYQPTSSAASSITLALVQGNIPGEQRWQPAHYAATLLKYASVTRRGLNGTQPDLVVWPEFAVGFYLDKNHFLRSQLGVLTRRVNTALLLGAPRRENAETGQRYYNSAYLVAPGGKILDVYDKRRLIPFAEYQPFGSPALLSHTANRPNEFTAGTRPTIFRLPHSPFGVMICYEATYPALARQAVRGGAQFLVNISNDTWLVAGGEAAAAQHFSMVVFRAVENRRTIARAATAGISGFIDPAGRPHQISAAAEGVIVDTLVPRQELTVYARYGDWFACVCMSVSLVAGVGVRKWR